MDYSATVFLNMSQLVNCYARTTAQLLGSIQYVSFQSFESLQRLHPTSSSLRLLFPGGGGVLPYKGLMGTCGQPGYVLRDFCLKQGIDFIIFCLDQGIDFINFCLKQGIFLDSFVIANGLNKKEF